MEDHWRGSGTRSHQHKRSLGLQVSEQTKTSSLPSYTFPSPFRLLPMQQLLLLSAMRPERISQCMVSFVSTVLHQVLHQVQTLPPQGQPQTQPQAGQHRLKRTIVPMDFTKVAKTVGAEQVPVILFREEPQLAVDKLRKFTAKAGVSTEIHALHSHSNC